MMTFQSKKEKPRLFIFLLVPVIFFGGPDELCSRYLHKSDVDKSTIHCCAECGLYCRIVDLASDANTVTSLGLPGIITISGSSSFQPSGTLLGSSAASFLTSGHKETYPANQILFRCNQTAVDAGLYEFYATNGDENYSGKNAASEVDGSYFTYVKNVAIRLTNMKTGEYYSRYWKSRQLTR
jgi:hypothetical protein